MNSDRNQVHQYRNASISESKLRLVALHNHADFVEHDVQSTSDAGQPPHPPNDADQRIEA
jgi:hypothetical protein